MKPTVLGKSKVSTQWQITLIDKTRPFLPVNIGDEVQFRLTEDGAVVIEKATEAQKK